MKNLILFFSLLLFFPFLCNANEFKVGMNVHISEYPLTAEKYVSLLKKYNIASIRVDYPWKYVEKSKGVFTSNERLDDFIFLAHKEGIDVLIILDYGNPLYGIGKPYNKEQVNAFLNYTGWVAGHFKNIHPTYEVWNEWSLQRPRDKSQNAESSYAYFSLTKAISIKIKNIDPSAIIIAGSFSPYIPGDVVWAKRLIDLGIMHYIDGISIHPYNHDVNPIPTVNESVDKIVKLQNYLFGNNESKQNIYITEYGFPTYSNSISNLHDVSSYSYELISALSNMPTIKGIWWYELVDEISGDPNNNYGLLNSKFKEKNAALGFIKLKYRK